MPISIPPDPISQAVFGSTAPARMAAASSIEIESPAKTAVANATAATASTAEVAVTTSFGRAPVSQSICAKNGPKPVILGAQAGVLPIASAFAA